MNQGYISKENMGGSQKTFSGNKCDYKVLPKADDLKKGFSDSIAGPMQHKTMTPDAPKYKN